MRLFHYHLVTRKVREVEARYIGKLGFELVARHGRIGEDTTSFEPGLSWAKLDGTGGGYQNNGFAFHTTAESNPWIVIDLQQAYSLTRLEIVNRRDDPNALGRAKTLTVWVSTSADGPWTPLWAARDAQQQWDIELPSPVPARFVKLGLREQAIFHLFSVKIFGY